MPTTRHASAGILADANSAKRDEIVALLTRAYWMEMETVMSYLAQSAYLDGIRAEEIAEALAKDVDEELGHARAFATRIKDLYGTPPGSMDFTAEQSYLQPLEDSTGMKPGPTGMHPVPDFMVRLARLRGCWPGDVSRWSTSWTGSTSRPPDEVQGLSSRRYRQRSLTASCWRDWTPCLSTWR